MITKSQYDIINIGFVLYFILRSNEQKEGFCMSKKNGELRNKLVRLVASFGVLAIFMAILALVPAFQQAKYEIQDNQLIVERNNMYNTNMDVILTVIDENGNVREETVKVHFEEDEINYTFDQEYFKNALETEDDVYIVDIDGELDSFFSNFTPVIRALMIIVFVLSLIACFFFIMSIFNLIH